MIDSTCDEGLWEIIIDIKFEEKVKLDIFVTYF